MTVTSLVGFTAERKAYSTQFRTAQVTPDGTSTHYEGAVPVEDMQKYLFGWEAVKAPLSAQLEDGGWAPADRFTAIVRSDTKEVLGIHKPGYTIHQPTKFLIDHMAKLAGDEVLFAGGGLIRGGAVGYAEVTLAQPVEHAGLGISFRPNIVGFTSFDASRATDYVDSARLLICENQFPALARKAKETGLSYRHTVGSLARAESDTRVATEILQNSAAEFLGTAVRLSRIPVGVRARDRFLDLWAPMPPEDAHPRSITTAQVKRDQLVDILSNHPAVTPFDDTAFKLWQAVNLHGQHVRPTRGNGRTREIANAERVIDGRQASEDERALEYIYEAVA